MCGIAGAYFRSPQEDSALCALAARMLDSIAHRGPDDGGYAAEPRALLGNRRLSIFDLSPAGNQPFFSADGSLWLVLNGEIYNHVEIRRELEAEYRFASRTDTEVLLHAYEKWGLACLERCVGMFAFGLWDSRAGRMVLCRDRLGIKPLYYRDDGHALVFASEIKAILAAGAPARMDRAAVRDYLALGLYDHTDRTFFEGIRQLRQGHCLTISAEGVADTCYWNPADFTGAAPLDPGDALDAYWSVLEDAVALRMRADVPCAVMLSGGLDSSTLAVMAEPSARQRPLNVMTFRHHDPLYDEGPWADLVAREHDWARHTVYVTEEVVAAQFDRLLWHQDEPFGGVACFADSLLAGLARERGIYVLLEGQGADETLAGYEYYYLHRLADLAEADEAAARELYGRYAARRGLDAARHGSRYEDFMRRALARGGNLAQDGTAATQPQVLAEALRREPGTGYADARLSGSALANALHRDLAAAKIPRVLRFKDKASMMHGVELRVPFLDHRAVAAAFRIPPELKLADGYTKHCLRARMRGRLPEETCFHVKRQVQTPQREWMRTTLRPLIEETIGSASFADRGLVDVDAARRLYADYRDRPDRYPNSFFLWQWVSLERWARLFLDGRGAPAWQARPAVGNTRRFPPAGPGRRAA